MWKLIGYKSEMASLSTRALDCPICFEVPNPPIFQCSNGHIICSNCLPKISNCGICRDVLSGKPIRNLVAEELAEMAKLELSCNPKFRGVNYCDLLGVAVVLDCREKISKSDIVSHMEKHLLPGVIGNSADVIQELQDFTNEQSWFPVYFDAYDEIFFLLCNTEKYSQTDSTTQISWKCVMVSDDPNEAEDFYVRLTLTSRINGQKMQFITPIACIEDSEASPTGKFSLTLNVPFVQDFSTRTESKLEWTIRVNIEKAAQNLNSEFQNQEYLRVPRVKTYSFSTRGQEKLSNSILRFTGNPTTGRPKVFLDLTYEDEPIGRLVIELLNDIVPFTAENFRALCTGEKGYGYKGCSMYYIDPMHFMAGGDITKNDGTGGKSIYGARFADENFTLSHGERGIVTMINSFKPNNNSSMFLITLRDYEELDGRYVAFGRVIQGLRLVNNLENLIAPYKGRLNTKIAISNCGQL